MNTNPPRGEALGGADDPDRTRREWRDLIGDPELAQKLFETLREPMLVLTCGLRVIRTNQGFYKHFNVDPAETEDRLVYELGNGQWDIPALRRLLEIVLPDNEVFEDCRVEHVFDNIGRRIMLLNARRIDHVYLILLAIEDITERAMATEKERQFVESLQWQNADQTKVREVLQKITRSANEARTVRQVLRDTLRHICDYNEWRYGQVWMRENTGQGETVVFSEICFPPGDRAFESLRSHSLGTTVRPDKGFLGRTIAAKKPVWVEDMWEYDQWDRGESESLGIRAAIGCPVTVDGEVVAALEFVADTPLGPEKRFLDLLPDVGIQLAQVIRRKRLERAVADEADREQRRSGQELHDSLGQQMVALALNCDGLRRRLESEESGEVASVAPMAGQVKSIRNELSTLSRGLIPVVVDSEGLPAALRDLADQVTEAWNVQCVLEEPEPVTVNDNIAATHLYRIVQEATHNAARHAKAGRKAKRVERKVLKVSGRGEVAVSFDLPAEVEGNLIRFAAFVGEDHPRNLQHLQTGEIGAR